MATKPLELQSLKWPFVGLAVLLALTTAWAVYDEAIARRPWRTFQREFNELEANHLKGERERLARHLEDPEVKKQHEAALAELKAANEAITGNAEQRRAYDAAVAAEQKAKIDEAEKKLYLGFDKSEADASYYKLREARHENQGPEEKKLQAELDGWNKKIAEKTKVYNDAIARHTQAVAAVSAFVQRREKAQLEVDKFEKPLTELDERIAKSRAKWPDMEQYWVQGLKNSWEGPTVDRCQNCHVAINKGGFSAPYEVLEAKKANLAPADFKAQFALDAETVDAYQKIHDALCEDVPAVPGAIPIGGVPAAAELTPVDPAAATECRPRASLEKWMSMAEAYCGPQNRWLPRTKTVWKDKAGAVLPVFEKAALPKAAGLPVSVARNPAGEAMHEEGKGAAHAVEGAAEEGLVPPAAAQVCAEKDTVTAFEEAAKVNPFDVKPVFRTHPKRFDLLVKTHPPEQFGCTTCHGGEGAQTKGVMHKAFRHGEDDHHWNDPLTDEVRVFGQKYKGSFMQAKCSKCHEQELTLAEAPTLSKGKKLFIDVGCWGCHPIEGYNELPKRGPTLTNIASKTKPGWLTTWIAFPRGWRPATRMPNFWPGAVDAAAVPHPEGQKPEDVVAEHRKLREQEVAAIAAYLWTSSEKAPLLADARVGDAAKGKETFESVGCKACHVVEKGSAARRSEASPERDYAPNLWNVADKAKPDWIYSWVKNPKALWPETKMPDLRLSDDEAANVTAYLLTLKSDQEYPEPPEYAAGQAQSLAKLSGDGKALIGKYGCFGCHNIKGFETAQKIGTELTEHGRKGVELLDFGDVRYFTEDPKHRQTYANWVWEKLHVPRIFAYERVETKMPQFDFTDEEALSILTFLKGQTGDKPTREFLAGQEPQQAAVLKGEQLVYWNGCRNCHVIEKRGGVVRDQYNEDTQSFAPPVLTGEGWKVQPEWLFGFLKGPVPLRPWLQIRMPTFHFPDADATGLVHAFAAASNKSFPYLTTEIAPMSPARQKEAEALFTELKCISCHVVGQLRPGQDPSAAAPNLLMAKHRLRPDWIPAWLKNPQALLDGTRMPSFWDFADEAHPTAPSKAFNGDAKAQIEALRDYLMHLEAAAPKGPGKTADARTGAPPPRG